MAVITQSARRSPMRGNPPRADQARGNKRFNPPGTKPGLVEHPILFQKFFKSIGPRTYVAQMKKATNGNHYFVLTEGRRDEKTGEVYKKRINVFSEDFEAFIGLIRDVAQFSKAHPVPEAVRRRQAVRWNKAPKR